MVTHTFYFNLEAARVSTEPCAIGLPRLTLLYFPQPSRYQRDFKADAWLVAWTLAIRARLARCHACCTRWDYLLINFVVRHYACSNYSDRYGPAKPPRRSRSCWSAARILSSSTTIVLEHSRQLPVEVATFLFLFIQRAFDNGTDGTNSLSSGILSHKKGPQPKNYRYLLNPRFLLATPGSWDITPCFRHYR